MAQYHFPLYICKGNKVKGFTAQRFADAESHSSPILCGAVDTFGAKASLLKADGVLASNNYHAFLSDHPDLSNLADFELLLKFSAVSKNALNLYNIGQSAVFRISGGDGYWLSRASNGATNRSIRLYKITDQNSNIGTSSNTAYPADPTVATWRAWQFLRVKVLGTSIMAKIWNEGSEEPATWQLTTTNSLFTSGKVGFGISGYTDYPMLYSFMSVGTNGDSAPTSFVGGLRTVAGTLLNPDDSLAIGKKVRIFDKETGYMLGEQVTNEYGQYDFKVELSQNDLVQIVGVDLINNEWKPPIHETYPIL